MTYEQSLEYLAGLSKFGIQLGLSRIEKLLEFMHHPERRFKTVHVTGTNGKGSTTAMLRGILTASGIKTGMYTSPHLVDYTERMSIDGESVSRQVFGETIGYTSRFVNQMAAEGWEHPTEFEVLTAAAFYYFAAAGVEYAVIEVGLGGLLDSTNVILPEAAVITNVTLEHTDRCGSTIEEIARHKAGIIKPGVPVITAARGAALKVIDCTAREKDAALYVLGRDFYGQFEGSADYRQKITIQTGRFGFLGAFSLNLLGRHQMENCAVAIMTAMLLAGKDSRIDVAAIREGLARVRWPGRFEIVSRQPLIVVDGAHNPDGARTLRESLDEFFPQRQVTFLLGILQDKDIAGIVGILIRPQDQAVVVAPLSERAGDPAKVAEKIVARHVETASSIAAGIKRVKALSGEQGLICMAGSLYLIGTARQLIGG
ncbi:MAG: folylpolyglutamate synthase/dihydrofolate synthase family protein [Veillonellales bacterium]